MFPNERVVELHGKTAGGSRRVIAIGLTVLAIQKPRRDEKMHFVIRGQLRSRDLTMNELK